jgi:hypothetical protein
MQLPKNGAHGIEQGKQRPQIPPEFHRKFHRTKKPLFLLLRKKMLIKFLRKKERVAKNFHRIGSLANSTTPKAPNSASIASRSTAKAKTCGYGLEQTSTARWRESQTGISRFRAG